jgi:ribosome-associated translation inhibitor RaiA
MRTRVTFRHMDSEPDLENHAYAALERVTKALEHEPSPHNVDLVLSPGRPHAHHQVELLILTPHINIVVKEEGPHMYQLIDHVCDIAYRKIHEHKERMIDERRAVKKGAF